MSTLVISRADAKAAGLKRYFTGKPCQYGHMDERQVVNGDCVSCVKAKRKERFAREPEKVKAVQDAWRAKNRDKMNALRIAKRAKNPEKFREAEAAHIAKNPERSKAMKVAWHQRNAERSKANCTAWNEANPEARAAIKRNRRARQKMAEGRHNKEDILRILAAQNGKCACCKTKVGKKYHVDHIQPLARGGSNWPSNLQILCPPCNASKRAKDPIEFMRSRGMLL